MTEQGEATTRGQLTGAERAAIVLRELGEDVASAVMRHMDDSAITRIFSAMTRLRNSPQAVRESVMDAFSADLGLDGGSDGISYISKVLVAALGEAEAREIIDRLTRNERELSLNFPINADPRTLAMQMAAERPQTIALLLAHIPHDTGAAMLTFLPEALATDALYRFTLLDVVSPGAVSELREMLAEHVTSSANSGRRVTNLGGARQTADILNHLHAGLSERVLGSIQERDSDAAGRIRDNLFTFTDLGKLPDRTLQIILREVPNDRLAPALRLVDETVRAHFFRNLSPRMAEVLREELKTAPPIRRSDALAAQKDIVDVGLRLSSEGRISIIASEEMV